MKILTIANQKGGVGKSTIACNLAVCAVKDGLKVLIIDADTQASSISFRAIRKADDLKAVSITQATIHKDINNFDNFDLVIVDAGGRDDMVFRSAIMSAANGLLLVPILPSQYDIWATEDTFKILEEARTYTDIKCCTVFNRVIQHTNITKDAHDTLLELIQGKNISILDTVLYSRVDYSKSISNGLGVIELDVKSKASKEVLALYQEIKLILEV